MGFCPMCGSDAPELDDCPTCNGYSSSSGNKFPPTNKTKLLWWGTYKDAIGTKLRIQRLAASLRTEDRQRRQDH